MITAKHDGLANRGASHVLDGLSGSGHVHGIGKVRPSHAIIVEFLLKHLVGTEPVRRHEKNIQD